LDGFDLLEARAVKKESTVLRAFAKASFVGSTEGTGKRRGAFLAVLALAICAFATSAAPASAAPPAVVMGTVSNASYTSAHVSGEVNAHGFAFYSFQYSTDEVNWTTYNFDLSESTALQPVEADLAGLKGGTKYFVRLVATDFAEEGISAGPNPEFETLPVETPAVLKANDATDVSYQTAKVSGEIQRPANPDPAFDADCRFEYVTDAQFLANGFQGAGEVPCGIEPLTNPKAKREVEAELTGLKPATKYHLRLTAFNAGGDNSLEAANTFTTEAVQAPSVISIDDVSSPGFTSAQASGEIERPANPDHAFDTECRFEYVTADQFAANGFEGATPVPCDPPNPLEAPTTNAPATASLTGLAFGTTYHLRLTASDAGGADSKVAASTFTTQTVTKPTVSIDPVLTFTDTTAHFSGHVNPGGSDPAFQTNWEFQCTPECPGLSGSVNTENSSQEVKADATGLEPGTAYEVKLVATNSAGAETAETAFATAAAGPDLQTVPAFALGNGTEALLGGKVNPKKQASKYWFEYGPTDTYGTKTPELDAGSGNQLLFETEEIAGLTPGATYHFRIAAKNATGTTHGEDLTFETATPISFPSNCPNLKLRTETNSAQLPECRAYEMVSDPQKNGGDASAALATTVDGDRVGYASGSGFADSSSSDIISSYLARRTAAGWATRGMSPPVAIPNYGLSGSQTFEDFTADLSKAVSISHTSAVESGPYNIAQNIFMTSDDGSTEWITKPTISKAPIFDKLYAGRSEDGSQIFFESRQEYVPGSAKITEGIADPLGSGTTVQVPVSQLWEWHNGTVQLVSVVDDKPSPQTGLIGGSISGTVNASGWDGVANSTHGISNDGRHVFFQSGLTAGTLYVRIDGQRTEAVSLSQRDGSIGDEATGHVKSFVQAATDGSRVLFAAEAPLTNDAPPYKEGFRQLYAYDVDSKHLTMVSSDAGAVLGVSPDAERAYLASDQQLVPGRGEPGQNNLYMIDGQSISYVASIGHAVSPTPQLSPDGSLFGFRSTSQLTAFDNAGHSELYVYDSSDGRLRCVSCAPSGDTAQGNARFAGEDEKALAAPTYRTHAIAADGDQVLFETTDALVPEDVNGQQDVYLSRDGNVALLSTGTSNYPSAAWVSDPDGSNVFLTTRDSLVGQDIDKGSVDIYDARINGGFPAPVPPVSCEGENCQGKAAPPPVFSTPPTATGNGKGNVPKRKPGSCKKGKGKQKHGAKCGSNAKHGGKGRHGKSASNSRGGK
jgi:hypothetical protein